LNDERVKIKHVDGRLWLKTAPTKYDLIFIGIMEPANLQTNRFFTREFFSLAKQRLDEGGILVLGAPGSLTYSGEALKDLNGCIFHTLKSVLVVS
jgi:spermidine synthase